MRDFEWLQDVVKEMVIAAGLSLVGIVSWVKVTGLVVEWIRGIF